MSREVYISIYILAVAVAVVLIPDSLTSNSAWQGHVWNTYTKQYLSLFQDRAQCISLEEGSSSRKAAQRNATLLNQANIGLFWTPAFSLDNKYEVFFLILDEQPILGVLPCHTYLIIPWASQSMQFKETEHFLTMTIVIVCVNLNIE